MVRIEFEIPDYVSYLGGALGPVPFGLTALEMQIVLSLAVAHVEAVELAAKAAAPSKSGKLRKSIRAFMLGPGGGVLVAEAPYARYLHEGTGVHGPKRKPYKIKPKRKLSLNWPGAGHPVRAVVHEGIKPRDFLRLAMTQAHAEMQVHVAEMSAAMNSAANAASQECVYGCHPSFPPSDWYASNTNTSKHTNSGFSNSIDMAICHEDRYLRLRNQELWMEDEPPSLSAPPHRMISEEGILCKINEFMKRWECISVQGAEHARCRKGDGLVVWSECFEEADFRAKECLREADRMCR